MLKKIPLLALLIFFCFWFPAGYRRWTHTFHPNKCLIQWPTEPAWDIDPLSKNEKLQLHTILNQSFSYLAKGGQSYAFESPDQKYVIKLFHFDSCKTPFGQKLVRKLKRLFHLRTKHSLPTSERIKKDFHSCKLAYELAKEQTGLVFIHLNPQKTDLPAFKVKDRLGRSFQIDPSVYRFILQKKAEPFLKTFYANQHNLQPFIDSYFTLLDELADKGLVNLDGTMGHNFGFLGDRCIQIDLGDFILSPEEAKEKTSPFKIRLQKWIAKRIPKLDS